MTTHTYDVPGMSCGHCRAAIEAELAPLEGVEHVDVDVEAKTVAVTGSANDEAMRAAIDVAGYDVAGVR